MRKYLHLLFCIPFLFSACSSDSEEMDPMDPLVTSTYTGDVKGIMDDYCLTCHKNPPANGAPMGLTTASSVKEAILDRGLIERVEEGSMPPSGNLTAAQIKALKDWKKGGFK